MYEANFQENYVNDCKWDFRNWFVLQVRQNRELFIQNYIKRRMDNQFKVLVFSRELLHTNKTFTKKIIKPMFPGYIFVYKDIYKILHFLKKELLNEYFYPITFDKKIAMVREYEMRLLLSNCCNNGYFEISKGYFSIGDNINIISGPLKNFKGKILFINKKKNRAKVQVTLFNQVIELSLGLEIIDKDYTNNLYNYPSLIYNQ